MGAFALAAGTGRARLAGFRAPTRAEKLAQGGPGPSRPQGGRRAPVRRRPVTNSAQAEGAGRWAPSGAAASRGGGPGSGVLRGARTGPARRGWNALGGGRGGHGPGGRSREELLCPYLSARPLVNGGAGDACPVFRAAGAEAPPACGARRAFRLTGAGLPGRLQQDRPSLELAPRAAGHGTRLAGRASPSTWRQEPGAWSAALNTCNRDSHAPRRSRMSASPGFAAPGGPGRSAPRRCLA